MSFINNSKQETQCVLTPKKDDIVISHFSKQQRPSFKSIFCYAKKSKYQKQTNYKWMNLRFMDVIGNKYHEFNTGIAFISEENKDAWLSTYTSCELCKIVNYEAGSIECFGSIKEA